MDRLEIIKELHMLESRKGEFENISVDANNYYEKEIIICPKIIGNNYNKHYQQTPVEVNVELFRSYVKSEIDQLEEEIRVLINKLKVKA